MKYTIREFKGRLWMWQQKNRRWHLWRVWKIGPIFISKKSAKNFETQKELLESIGAGELAYGGYFNGKNTTH